MAKAKEKGEDEEEALPTPEQDGKELAFTCRDGREKEERGENHWIMYFDLGKCMIFSINSSLLLPVFLFVHSHF